MPDISWRHILGAASMRGCKLACRCEPVKQYLFDKNVKDERTSAKLSAALKHMQYTDI
jgi:hypothetical protein